MFFPEETQGFRFERKFLTDQLSYHQLEHLVLSHPACFRQMFFQRKVNNIYFDTPDLRFFDDNTSGRSDRVKVRIRWYGNSISDIEQPTLEFKIKKGLVGRKASFKMNDFVLNNNATKKYFDSYFRKQDLPDQVLEFLLRLEPVLINSYRRNYFMSFDNKFRFTIDQDLIFYDVRSLFKGKGCQITDRFNRVLELKYDQENDDSAADIVGVLPIRVTKSSKYVSGIYSIRPDLAI